jgi:hypothetical protein
MAASPSRLLLASLRDAFKRNRGNFNLGEGGKWATV